MVTYLAVLGPLSKEDAQLVWKDECGQCHSHRVVILCWFLWGMPGQKFSMMNLAATACNYIPVHSNDISHSVNVSFSKN